MTPLDRLRLEKAAADCGFEMTTIPHPDGLELRSARFPETVLVRALGEDRFELVASDPAILYREIGDGKSIKVEGFGELYAVLRTSAAHARTKPNRVADEFKKKTAAMPKTTEAERLVVQRIGQDFFRNELLDFWQGRCSVTGLAVPALLRASHIKPWAKCVDDNERLDVFNGLLLAPHIDALFDGGWISFTDLGKVMVSDALPAEAKLKLGVSDEWSISRLNSRHIPYLSFHRSFQLRASSDIVDRTIE